MNRTWWLDALFYFCVGVMITLLFPLWVVAVILIFALAWQLAGKLW